MNLVWTLKRSHFGMHVKQFHMIQTQIQVDLLMNKWQYHILSQRRITIIILILWHPYLVSSVIDRRISVFHLFGFAFFINYVTNDFQTDWNAIRNLVLYFIILQTQTHDTCISCSIQIEKSFSVVCGMCVAVVVAVVAHCSNSVNS